MSYPLIRGSYGALKGTSFKWLDLPLLFKTILKSHHDIQSVKYFTAKVPNTQNDPSKFQRQNTYLGALQKYRPSVALYLGHFLSHEVRLPLAHPTGNRRTVSVIKTEEKGSDVNLAMHLLHDAWQGSCDCAVVVTNDSDIAEALRLVKQHGAVRIGLVTPGEQRVTSRQLRKHADFSRHIRTKALQVPQLPNPIPGTRIRKPESW